MTFPEVLDALKRFPSPPGFTESIFQQDTRILEDLHAFVRRARLRDILELGTGYGATACVFAAAVEEFGGGRVVTVDRELYRPVNAEVLKRHLGFRDNPVVVVDDLGYCWFMKDLIKQQSSDDTCEPLFDLCYLDGAHTWDVDALAFFLVAKLIRPGGWLIMDDMAFHPIDAPEKKRKDLLPNASDRQLEEFHMGMVFNLCVRQHPDFRDFRITHDGRLGWARKTPKGAARWSGDDGSMAEAPGIVRRL